MGDIEDERSHTTDFRKREQHVEMAPRMYSTHFGTYRVEKLIRKLNIACDKYNVMCCCVRSSLSCASLKRFLVCDDYVACIQFLEDSAALLRMLMLDHDGRSTCPPTIDASFVTTKVLLNECATATCCHVRPPDVPQWSTTATFTTRVWSIMDKYVDMNGKCIYGVAKSTQEGYVMARDRLDVNAALQCQRSACHEVLHYLATLFVLQFVCSPFYTEL